MDPKFINILFIIYLPYNLKDCFEALTPNPYETVSIFQLETEHLEKCYLQSFSTKKKIENIRKLKGLFSGS